MDSKRTINGIELKENPYMVYIELQEKARKKAIALNEQAKLDFQKWLDSERKETDMSGAEPWCYFCKHRKENVTCGCDPEIRTKEAICVEAYHEMQQRLHKG